MHDPSNRERLKPCCPGEHGAISFLPILLSSVYVGFICCGWRVKRNPSYNRETFWKGMFHRKSNPFERPDEAFLCSGRKMNPSLLGDVLFVLQWGPFCAQMGSFLLALANSTTSLTLSSLSLWGSFRPLYSWVEKVNCLVWGSNINC